MDLTAWGYCRAVKHPKTMVLSIAPIEQWQIRQIISGWERNIINAANIQFHKVKGRLL